MHEVAKPYSTLKNAGTHWLGKIPAHWEEKRGKFFFREVDERSQTGREELLSVSHKTGVTPRSQKNVTMFKAESYIGHKLARKDDIVINTMWAWMAALGVATDTGIVSPAYGVYRPHSNELFDPRYLDYLLRTPMMKWEYLTRSTGIRSSRLRLYPDKFLDISFPRPPLEEQIKMVAFLRVKESQIARLIRNKQRLIALLNEQKQGIINRAVTRGLDPVAPMKPTGIDWMPVVPAHWEVKPLKQVCSVQFSNVDKHSLAGEKPVLLCNYTDVYKNDFIDSSMDFMAATASDGEIARFSLEPGDVMITKDSEAWDDIGVPALVHEPLERVLCGYHLALLRSKQDMLTPEFLFYAFSATSIMQQLHIAASGVTRYGLSKLSIKNTLLPIPDTVAEQQSIVEQIVKQTDPIDKAKMRIDQEITLIQEYRQRLIADVVTGKLDVRGVDLPELDADAVTTPGIPLDATPEPAEVDA